MDGGLAELPAPTTNTSSPRMPGLAAGGPVKTPAPFSASRAARPGGASCGQDHRPGGDSGAAREAPPGCPMGFLVRSRPWARIRSASRTARPGLGQLLAAHPVGEPQVVADVGAGLGPLPGTDGLKDLGGEALGYRRRGQAGRPGPDDRRRTRPGRAGACRGRR